MHFLYLQGITLPDRPKGEEDETESNSETPVEVETEASEDEGMVSDAENWESFSDLFF